MTLNGGAIWKRLPSIARLFLLGGIVGVAAGGLAAGFHETIDLVSHGTLGVAGYVPPAPGGSAPGSERIPAPERPLWILVVPALGGLAAGWIVFRHAPEAEGHGTDAVIRAFHRGRGEIRFRVPWIKGVASALTIGTGGSAGREGPIAQMGAGLASFLGRLLSLSARERRILLIAGAAGGIGAIFKAPLGGAIFATEVLYRDTDFEHDAIVPSIFSSILAYYTFVSIHGSWDAVFRIEPYHFREPRELPLYLLFAGVCAAVGFLYVRAVYGVRNAARRVRLPDWIKPGIGGLAVGGIAYFLPQALGGGYGWIQRAIDGLPVVPGLGHHMVLGLLLLVGVKIVATALTIGTGGSGGVFAPSLFIGGLLGAAFGHWTSGWYPGVSAAEVPEFVGAFTVVGMGGFFAGVAKVPISALILVSEMTGGYGLLPPLMLVCAVHFLLSQKWTLYEEQVPSRIDSPAHRGDFVVDVLESIRVGDLEDRFRRPVPVPETMPIGEVLDRVVHSRCNVFPVVGADGRMIGIFSLDDVRDLMQESDLPSFVIARDIAVQPVLSVAPGDDLNVALRRFVEKNVEEIPVVDDEDPGRVLGLLTRREVIQAYARQMQALRWADGEAGDGADR